MACKNREISFSKVYSEVLRTTDKAYQLKVLYWTSVDKPVKEAKMWCPKSCCKADNGIVVEIADFILNNWVKEHNEYIRAYTHVIPNISFDIDEKNARLISVKENERKQRERHDEILNRIVEKAKPYADKFMQELAYVCINLGTFLRTSDKGFDVDVCDEMVDLGKKVAKVFGNGDFGIMVEEYQANFVDKSKADIMNVLYTEFVDACYLYGLRVSYENTIEREGFTHREFMDVRCDIDKKFKKNIEFRNRFCEIFQKLNK